MESWLPSGVGPAPGWGFADRCGSGELYPTMGNQKMCHCLTAQLMASSSLNSAESAVLLQDLAFPSKILTENITACSSLELLETDPTVYNSCTAHAGIP